MNCVFGRAVGPTTDEADGAEDTIGLALAACPAHGFASLGFSRRGAAVFHCGISRTVGCMVPADRKVCRPGGITTGILLVCGLSAGGTTCGPRTIGPTFCRALPIPAGEANVEARNGLVTCMDAGGGATVGMEAVAGC